ncbi:MAG: sigma-70 family RNA polymerase sigma factor, partial [Acidobacteriota bacterium]
MESALATSGGTVGRQSPDFDRVVQLHQRKIYFLALDLTGNHHDAEDLAQEVFFKAYKGLKRFRGEAGLSTWLHRITVNTNIDRQRKRSEAVMKRQRSWDDEENPLPPLPDLNPDRNPEKSAEAATI